MRSFRLRCWARCFSTVSGEDPLPIRGPAVGLFADQEIRLLRGRCSSTKAAINLASLKDSDAPFAAERARLYG